MNLLPKSHQDFSKTDYWNTFFKKRGTKAFEWYGEYPELCSHLHKYIKHKDEILTVGCGNSTLSADLYDVGFKSNTNVDVSPVVVQQMIQKHKYERPDLTFLQMDALNMTFDDESFNVVLDKGTLDALMTDDSEEVDKRITKYFGEIERVLRPNGRYICVSLLQKHILDKMLSSFGVQNWILRMVRCHEAEQKSGDGMAVFMAVATKFKNLPQTILEVCLSGQKIVRLKSHEEASEAILNAQKVATVTNSLANKHLDETEEITLELTKPEETDIRYTVHISDQSLARKNGAFAAFIVPQGREVEWMFSTKDGRKELRKSAGFNRLAIVTMHRYQNYGTLDDVKAELAESIQNLAPKDISGQIPFLSLGSDVGKRDIIHRGTSEYSGGFVIEEVRGQNEEIFRRLIFLNNQSIIQSESKLKTIKNKKGKKTLVIDYGYLACSHHTYMTVGIEMAVKNAPGHAIVVGLGGGGLCSFLQRCFENLKITAIDIDAEILNVAQKFFGLTCDDRLSAVIKDGLICLEEYANSNRKYNAILFDVDSKDTSVGMSCPPKKFVEPAVLNNVNKCLIQNGFFILNLVCRDKELKEQTVKDLQIAFQNVASYRIDQEVNEIFFCTNKPMQSWKDELKSASDSVNSNVISKKLQQEPIVDVEDLLKMFKIANKVK